MPDDTVVVPDVRTTALDRADLEEAAEELGLHPTGETSDQELFERIGVALGALDEGAVGHAGGEETAPRPTEPPPASMGLRPRTVSFLGLELHLGGFHLAPDPQARPAPLARPVGWLTHRATRRSP